MAFTHILYFTVSFAFIGYSLHGLDIEPKCSKFDFEEKVLEKMVRMEHSAELLRDRFDELSSQLNGDLETMKDENGQLKQETKRELVRLMEQVAGTVDHMMNN